MARSRKGNRFAGGKPVLASFKSEGMTPKKLCCLSARSRHVRSARTWRWAVDVVKGFSTIAMKSFSGGGGTGGVGPGGIGPAVRVIVHKPRQPVSVA